MKLIELDRLTFLGGTFDNYHVAKYGTFIFNEAGKKVANEFVVDINQGDDSIVFVEILGREVEEHFIIENMQFESMGGQDIAKVVNIYNNMVRKKHRRKQLNTVLK